MKCAKIVRRFKTRKAVCGYGASGGETEETS